MTRQDVLRKWCAYALALIPVWLLDAYVLSRWTFFGVSALLLPVAVIAVGTLEGVTGGMGFGLGAGLLWATVYPGGQGHRVLLLTAVGLAAGALAQYVLSRTFLGCFVASAAILAVLNDGAFGLPLCAAGAVSLTVAIWGEYWRISALRRSFRVLTSSRNLYTVSGERGITKEAALLKSRRSIRGFIRRSLEPD